MSGSWIYDGEDWTRMFSVGWAMDVRGYSTSLSGGVRGVLCYHDHEVLHVVAPTVTECKEKIEKHTRDYFNALLVDLATSNPL